MNDKRLQLVPIAVRGARLVLAHPGLLLSLLCIHLVFALALWASTAWRLAPWLARRPDPDLFGWLVLLLGHPSVMLELCAITLATLVVYLLVGSLVLGSVLEHLRGGRWLHGVRRHTWGLVRFRFLVWVALGLTLAGWIVSAPPVYRLSLQLDHDKAPALIQLLLALLFGLPVATLLLIYRYGQCLVVQGLGPLRAVRRALGLLHRRTTICLGLWLLGWLAWLAVSVLSWRLHEWWWLSVQMAVLLRAGIFVWEYASAQLCISG